MEAAHAARPPRYRSASDAELLRDFNERGDIDARQELIERHIGFVRRLAQRYASRGEQLDDLTQVGCVGLIKAIDRFDGGYGASLTTYGRRTSSARSSVTSATAAGRCACRARFRS